MNSITGNNGITENHRSESSNNVNVQINHAQQKKIAKKGLENKKGDLEGVHQLSEKMFVLMQSMKNASDIHVDNVAAIKNSVHRDEYTIDSLTIANKLLDFESLY
jgi:anti-sigma28 factor (negative regulator of flagellin synthesis)